MFFAFLFLSGFLAPGAGPDETCLDSRWEAFLIDIVGADGTVRHSNLRTAALTLGSRGEKIASAVQRAAAGLSDEQLSRYLNGLRRKSIGVDLSALRLHEEPSRPAILDLRHEDLLEAQVDLIERAIAERSQILRAGPPLTPGEKAALERQVSRVCLELQAMYAGPEARAAEWEAQEQRRLGIPSTAPAASPPEGPNAARLTAFLKTLVASLSAASDDGWTLRPVPEQKLDALVADMRSAVSSAEAIEKGRYGAGAAAARAEEVHRARSSAIANAPGPALAPMGLRDSYGVQVRLFMRSLMGYPSSMPPETARRLEALATARAAANEKVLVLQKKYGLEEGPSKPAGATSQPS